MVSKGYRTNHRGFPRRPSDHQITYKGKEYIKLMTPEHRKEVIERATAACVVVASGMVPIELVTQSTEASRLRRDIRLGLALINGKVVGSVYPADYRSKITPGLSIRRGGFTSRRHADWQGVAREALELLQQLPEAKEDIDGLRNEP